MRRIMPELDLLILSFPLHFTWELSQAPLFSNMLTVTHVEGIRICLQATLGDMVIALVAFWVTAVAFRSRQWAAFPLPGAIAVFIGTGLLITVAIEFRSTEILGRWDYGPSMPRLPLIGTGLSPLLQWILVPSLVLWYLHRLSPSLKAPKT